MSLVTRCQAWKRSYRCRVQRMPSAEEGMRGSRGVSPAVRLARRRRSATSSAKNMMARLPAHTCAVCSAQKRAPRRASRAVLSMRRQYPAGGVIGRR